MKAKGDQTPSWWARRNSNSEAGCEVIELVHRKKKKTPPSLEAVQNAIDDELQRIALCHSIIGARRSLHSEFSEKWQGSKSAHVANFHYECVWQTLILSYSRIWDPAGDALSLHRFYLALKDTDDISEFVRGGDRYKREAARVESRNDYRIIVSDKCHISIMKMRTDFLAHRLIFAPDEAEVSGLPRKGDILRLSANCFELFSKMTLATLSKTFHYDEFRNETDKMGFEYFRRLLE